MHLDFLEIGTANFRTLIQEAKDTDVGISVEPLDFYLNELPDKPNVKKINVAITHDRKEDDIIIYYIPQHVIREHNLKEWLRGCNKIGEPHPTVMSLGYKKYMHTKTVPLMNVDELVEEHQIKSIDFLKIDTEGHDHVIMKGFYNLIKKQSIQIQKIVFETNEITPEHIIKQTTEQFCNLGYRGTRSIYDTQLVL